jgi:hypothetical protein
LYDSDASLNYLWLGVKQGSAVRSWNHQRVTSGLRENVKKRIAIFIFVDAVAWQFTRQNLSKEIV